MIYCEDLINHLKKEKINFFTGVPDSVLKSLSPYMESEKKNHIIAVNEGSAVSIGIGYHLSTKKLPCIYFQNSGLGNAVNPLASIAHDKVYSVPLLLMIGWRGSPNLPDEPQHKVKGEITKKLLKLLNIDYCHLKSKKDLPKLSQLIQSSRIKLKPVACLIENKTLIQKKNKRNIKPVAKSNIKRIEVIEKILNYIDKKTLIISSTGFASRELMQIRKIKNLNKGKDFYMVGGMGHSSSVSLGVSLFTKKNTICIDGDGSMLMHLGSIFSLSFFGPKNIKYILINNNSHESVGSQTTNIDKINFKLFAKSLGFKKFYQINKKKELDTIIKGFIKTKGPCFLEVKIKIGSIENLSRPKDLISIKKIFMKK